MTLSRRARAWPVPALASLRMSSSQSSSSRSRHGPSCSPFGEHVEQVAGAGQQGLGVDDVVEAAPVPPAVGQGAQDGGLAGAGRAVQEEHPPGLRCRRATHQRTDGLDHPPGVVALDVGPRGHVEGSVDPAGSVHAGVPEPDLDGARLGLSRFLDPVGGGGEHVVGQVTGHRRDGDVGGGIGPDLGHQRPTRPGGQHGPASPVMGLAARLDAGRHQAGVGADPLEPDGHRHRLLTAQEGLEPERADQVDGVIVGLDAGAELGGREGGFHGGGACRRARGSGGGPAILAHHSVPGGRSFDEPSTGRPAGRRQAPVPWPPQPRRSAA